MAEQLGIHRNTAAKYLEILHSQGLAEVRKIGVTKLYYSSRRTPISCVLRLFLEPIFGVDRGRIIRSANQAALDLVGLSEEECIGRTVALLDEQICTGISDRITPSLHGKPSSFPVMRHSRGSGHHS